MPPLPPVQGDVETVDAMAEAVLRHSDAIGYDAFRLPGLLLEAWVTERRRQSEPRRGEVPKRP